MQRPTNKGNWATPLLGVFHYDGHLSQWRTICQSLPDQKQRRALHRKMRLPSHQPHYQGLLNSRQSIKCSLRSGFKKKRQSTTQSVRFVELETGLFWTTLFHRIIIRTRAQLFWGEASFTHTLCWPVRIAEMCSSLMQSAPAFSNLCRRNDNRPKHSQFRRTAGDVHGASRAH